MKVKTKVKGGGMSINRFGGAILFFLLFPMFGMEQLSAETDAKMDFQSLEIEDVNLHLWGPEFEEDGFRFTAVGGNLWWHGTLATNYAGSTAMFHDTPGGIVMLSHVTGAPFDLKSMNISNLNNNGPVTVDFVGFLAGGGSVNASFTTLGAPNGLQTFVFPPKFRGLISVEWSQDSPYHQFDNIQASTVDTIIDFQSLERVSSGFIHEWGFFYEEDGFSLTNLGANEFATVGTFDDHYPGSTALFNNTDGGLTVLENATGKPFDLISIDLSNLHNDGPVTIVFSGTEHCGGAAVTASFTTSGTENQLETFVLPNTFRNLDRVEWTQDAPFHQFDNIRVSSSDTLVDFQSLEVVGEGPDSNWGTYLEEDSFILTSPVGELASRQTMEFGYAGSTAIFNNTENGLVVLTSENGGPFNLISIEIATRDLAGGAVTVNFVGTKVGGASVNASYTTTNVSVLEPFTFPSSFTNLESVQWLQEVPYHQFDNLRMSQDENIIDFQSLATNNSAFNLAGPVYREDGFTLTCPFGDFAVWGTQSSLSPGSTALFSDLDDFTVLESSSGAPFDLKSIDISNWSNMGPVTVDFVGYPDGGGLVNQSFTTSGATNELERFEFPDSFSNLLVVEWIQEGPYHQFDNIRVALTETVAPANSFTEFRGVLVSGDLSSTTDSDDSYLIYNPGLTLTSTEAPVWLIFESVSPNACDTLELLVEAQVGTPGLEATLEAWNWSTSSYDDVDVSAGSFNSDEVVTVDLSGAIEDYRQSDGAVQVRIGWRKTGLTFNFPWEVRLDQIGWIIN